MNNTLKILATAIPMTFLAGCYPNGLQFSDFEVRLVKENMTTLMNDTPPYAYRGVISIVAITCRSDKPLKIVSISVNGGTPKLPFSNDPMPPSGPFQVVNHIMKWNYLDTENQKTENIRSPVTLLCHKGQTEYFPAAWTDSGNPEERLEVVDITIQTEDRGWVKYEFKS